jgi:hypothetical protein
MYATGVKVEESVGELTLVSFVRASREEDSLVHRQSIQ